MYWIFNAITRSGQEISGHLSGSKQDVLKQLSDRKLSIIEIKYDYRRVLRDKLPRKRLSSLSLAIFFEDFSNMLETGMNVSQVLTVLKDTAQEEALIAAMSELEEKLAQGRSLTESLSDSKNLSLDRINHTVSRGKDREIIGIDEDLGKIL